MKKQVNVGLIGFGTVGAGVAGLMFADDKPYLRGFPAGMDLVKIADIDTETDRGVAVPDGVLTADAKEIIDDPSIDIVIELIGGYEPALTFTLAAFEKGKSVVTANKALLARHGSELFAAAAKAGVNYFFEASVGGGIPLIRGIVNGLNANRIDRFYGILNGTTNYILTGMDRDGADYDGMLKNAQDLGYAEADPTSDVSGGDALNKLVILSRLCFGAVLDVDDVYCEGIENITVQDIDYAAELGCAVKLLAIGKMRGDGTVEARVHPTLVPGDSVMASVEDEFNAVEIYGNAVGREIFYGKGAGMYPTASAVVSDVVDAAGRVLAGAPSNVERIAADDGAGPVLKPFGDLRMRYYLRMTLRDRAGVLASIAGIFADHDISIESVIQKGAPDGEYAPIVIMTHEAREDDMRRSMETFGTLDSVRGPVQFIRVEDI